MATVFAAHQQAKRRAQPQPLLFGHRPAVDLGDRDAVEILHRGGDGHQQIGGTGPCSDGERHGDGGLLSRDGHIADHADHTKP